VTPARQEIDRFVRDKSPLIFKHDNHRKRNGSASPSRSP